MWADSCATIDAPDRIPAPSPGPAGQAALPPAVNYSIPFPQRNVTSLDFGTGSDSSGITSTTGGHIGGPSREAGGITLQNVLIASGAVLFLAIFAGIGIGYHYLRGPAPIALFVGSTVPRGLDTTSKDGGPGRWSPTFGEGADTSSRRPWPGSSRTSRVSSANGRSSRMSTASGLFPGAWNGTTSLGDTQEDRKSESTAHIATGSLNLETKLSISTALSGYRGALSPPSIPTISSFRSLGSPGALSEHPPLPSPQISSRSGRSGRNLLHSPGHGSMGYGAYDGPPRRSGDGEQLPVPEQWGEIYRAAVNGGGTDLYGAATTPQVRSLTAAARYPGFEHGYQTVKSPTESSSFAGSVFGSGEGIIKRDEPAGSGNRETFGHPLACSPSIGSESGWSASVVQVPARIDSRRAQRTGTVSSVGRGAPSVSEYTGTSRRGSSEYEYGGGGQWDVANVQVKDDERGTYKDGNDMSSIITGETASVGHSGVGGMAGSNFPVPAPRIPFTGQGHKHRIGFGSEKTVMGEVEHPLAGGHLQSASDDPATSYDEPVSYDGERVCAGARGSVTGTGRGGHDREDRGGGANAGSGRGRGSTDVHGESAVLRKQCVREDAPEHRQNFRRASSVAPVPTRRLIEESELRDVPFGHMDMHKTTNIGTDIPMSANNSPSVRSKSRSVSGHDDVHHNGGITSPTYSTYHDMIKKPSRSISPRDSAAMNKAHRGRSSTITITAASTTSGTVLSAGLVASPPETIGRSSIRADTSLSQDSSIRTSREYYPLAGGVHGRVDMV
ncbi:hypothetical protein HDU93_005430 [Gonapodya sp. JEL0774]|nr:hypothetical protein HDU93_005430 [Gonapodya sp. JEL0774]